MSTRTGWRPPGTGPDEQVVGTAKETLDKRPGWPVPLLVVLATLLGMGAGAWIAGNNERALDLTAERLDAVTAQLDEARADLDVTTERLAAARSGCPER